MTKSEVFRNATTAVQASYSSLVVNQKLYLNALLFLLLYSLFPKVINPEINKALLSIFLVFWVSAISYDLLTMYKKAYQTFVGKAILLLILTIFTNVAISLSAQVVNDVTGVNPSNFPHTQTILAVLMIPFLAVGVGMILYFAILVLSPLILMFHISDDAFKRFFIPNYSIISKLNYLKTTRLIQGVSMLAFWGFIYGFSQNNAVNYSTFVNQSAHFFIYNMEMYSRAPCVIEPGAKIAFISDEKILVGVNSGAETVFRLEVCKTKR